MSDSEPMSAAGRDDGPSRGPLRRRRRWLVLGVLASLVVAGTVLALTDPFAARGANSTSGVQDNDYPTSLQTVAEQSLSSQQQVSGTLGYAGSYDVVNQAQGTFTWLPGVGQVIRAGQVLYRVSNSPVVLLYGTTPLYRALSEGMSGPDVKQLNANLVRLRYATAGELDPTSDYFGSETAYALEQLQKALALSETGTLPLGQAIFEPGALRITQVSPALGTSAGGGPVAQATSTRREVTVDLDATQQAEVAVGDKVTITLPDDSTTPGVVTSVGKVATTPSDNGGGGGNPTVTVEIAPTHPAATGQLDQAPVEVAITTASVKHALVVPVDALLALANGGYVVEVVASGGVHSLVPVSLGLFDDADGLVQVMGSGLAAGEHVVVPGS